VAEVTSPTEDWSAGDADGDTAAVRRASYADSPYVGERGQKARRRILEAGLGVLAEKGYHEANVRGIAKAAGTSRAGFYQYFSSKEDLFRHLSGRVARLLARLTDDVGPIGPDADGRDTLRTWLDRYARLYQDYAPVFAAFETAAASDESVADGGARVAVRTFGALRSRVTDSPLTSRQIDSVIRKLPGVTVRMNRYVDLLRSLGAQGGLAAQGRIDDALADVFHRALFGVVPGANAHDPPAEPTPPLLPALPAVDPAAELAGDPSLSTSARRTRVELLDAGTRVFTRLGYYRARVDDVVADAGVSHGIFYKYFKNKTHLFRLLAERATIRIGETFAEIPALVGPDAVADVPGELRAWLTRYAATYADEATILSLWTEAMSRDAELRPLAAAMTESQRVAGAAVLAPRGYGDLDADALILVMALDGMTMERAVATRIEATASLFERAFLRPLPSA
jgi:AcrR family transcriptional regulator